MEENRGVQLILSIEKREEGPKKIVQVLHTILDPLGSQLLSAVSGSQLVSALSDSGMLGLRCYAPKQMLSVCEAGEWIDTEVEEASEDGKHTLLCGGHRITMALHPWNHAPLQLLCDTFEQLRRRWYDKFLSNVTTLACLRRRPDPCREGL